MKLALSLLVTIVVLAAAGIPAAAGCDDPFGCGGSAPDSQQKTSGGGHLTTLAYKDAKRSAIRKANRITGYHHGRATTMMRISRTKWYAQVTESDSCWVGMDVFLRRGRIATRVSENMCDDSLDTSGDTGGSICDMPKFTDVDYNPGRLPGC